MAAVAGSTQRCVRIEVLEGPIGDDRIGQICSLYGQTTDRRYADPEFTRRVFNGNPSGRSFHAFAWDGDKVVGCYSIIPMCVSARSRQVWAGKGEALFLREEYRPNGLFLVNQGLKFASERGMEFLFAITHDRLGRMLKMLGFKSLTKEVHQRFRLLRPGNVKMLTASRSQLVAAKLVRAAQAAAGATVSSFIKCANLSVDVNRDDVREEVFRTITTSHPSHSQWSAALDEQSLTWFNRFGKFDVLSINGRPDEFVLVERALRGGGVEILRWSVRSGGLSVALEVLQFVIAKAYREGASAVTIGLNADLSGQQNLQLCLALLGFMPRRALRTLYVKARDPFYEDCANADFDGLVSI